MTAQYSSPIRANMAAPFYADDDVPEPPTATGQYPEPVWVNGGNGAMTQRTLAWAASDETEEVPEPPTATGQYPDQVWVNGSNGAVAYSKMAFAAADQTNDPPISLKEADYSEEIGDAAYAESDPQVITKVNLSNEEIYRIIREVAKADSGEALYSAVSTDQANQFGLAFGVVLFTQHSGRLGRVLQLMQGRDAATFAEIFGPESETLLAAANAATPEERLQPVGGEPLWSATWVEKFRRAGEVPAFQAAQNEEAIEGLFRPMLKTADRLGLISDRGLAMAYDRVVVRGLGGGLRWLVQAAGALRTPAQRQHALQMLGYENLAQFQAAVGDIPQNGIFGPETHAALMAALRQQGAALLPSPEELVCRLVAVAQGAAKKRLMRLRDSNNLTDVIYNFG